MNWFVNFLCRVLPYKEIGWKEIGEVFHRWTLATRAAERSKQKQDLLMMFLIERDGDNCHICGKRVKLTATTWKDVPSVDHVVPLTKGGLNITSNVKLSHRGCNVAKGNKCLPAVA